MFKVYDGDTFNGLFNMFGNIYKHRFRMLGYDSPEIKLSKQDK